jgi:hypothetical protein
MLYRTHQSRLYYYTPHNEVVGGYTGFTWTDGWTDGETDEGHGETSIPPYNFIVGGIIIEP